VSIGAAITRNLKAKGWSQADLARRLGVSRSTVTDWCKGRKNPRGRGLDRLADAFGVTLAEFFGGEVEESGEAA
jgi:transcriptional regulator with XRE-family HTH domain